MFSLPQPDVLAQCYWYNERREVDLAIDSALDSFDGLLRGGQFRAADAVLRAVDVNRLHPDVSVAILVFTRAAAERLTNRERLIDRLRPILREPRAPRRHVASSNRCARFDASGMVEEAGSRAV